MSDSIKGVMVPALTPMMPDEEVDVASLRNLVDYLIDSGSHGIWAAGTTGEFASLSSVGHVKVIETIADHVCGRVPVVANVSASSTKLSVALAQTVSGMSLDGIAATPPYYYPCAQDELLEHFRYINKSSGMPLWIYNIPSTVKTVVDPATIATLSEEGTIVGVKDSSGAGELLAQLNVLCEQSELELYRFLGTTYRISNSGSVGAHGVIPGIANLIPRVCVHAWEAGDIGDDKAARKANADIMLSLKVQGLAKAGGPNASRLSGLKSALKIMGIFKHDTISRPLRPLTNDEKQPLSSIIRGLGLPVV